MTTTRTGKYPDTSSLPAIITETFAKIQARLKKEQSQSLTDEELDDLFGLFGETLERALQIVDKSIIKIYNKQVSNRTIIEIPGSNNSIYRFFANINYCSCEAYRYQVLKSHSQYTCKHILAAKIALLINKNIVTEVLTDSHFNVIVEHITSAGIK